MELRFRPDDGYCKPTCGDRHQTAAFLLRIRVKKSRREKVETSQLSSRSQNKKDLNVIDGNNSSQNDKDNSSTNETQDACVNELAEKIINCSVGSQASTIESNQNIDSEKNKPPTFDRDKYEHLSEDAEYMLPKLKVLGRVDTEFRFTSKHISIFLSYNNHHTTIYECF